ncbi:protein telomere ends associated-like [Drosophila subobscura]|uniref:protein telomere ends associated-like n=1 Tax=Drosophila subobscura TaxID=7241 RepID=UPI00155AAA54|nr:protein telomere ends associated-like [Drosophila subobscura]
MQAERKPAITFQKFSHLIKNLPDIAHDVQRDQAAKANKTLDECARCYYHAFYRDASVRERYKFKLRSLQHGAMEHKSTSPTTEQHQLREFYKSFYMFPEKRKTTNIFRGTTTTFMPKLLEAGHPIVESAAKSLAEHNKETITVEEPALHREPESRNASTLCTPDSDFSIVSFEEFQKYVLILNDIVWQLKLNDPQYWFMDFEECAHAFYFAFYLSPEIRERCKYTLKPCTSVMSARLLAVPTPEQADKLRQNLTELIKPSPDLERPELVEETVVAPVSFQFFKYYIKNLEEISEKMRTEDEFKTLSIETCTREYYRLFYRPPEIRERFQFNLKPCPGVVRKILLSPPTSSFFADSLERTAPNEADPQSPSEPILVTDLLKKGIKYPVIFEVFRRHINYDDIFESALRQVYRSPSLLSTLTANPLDPRCIEAFDTFYRWFYIFPHIRERVRYRFDCGGDPSLMEKLCAQAEILNENARRWVESATKPPPEKEITLITQNGIKYRLPVSFNTFCRSINVDELKVQLANHFSMLQLRQYYNSFYTSRIIREMYKYNFDSAPPELRAKCLQFAVSITEATEEPSEAEPSTSEVEPQPEQQSEIEPPPEIEPHPEIEQQPEIEPQPEMEQQPETETDLSSRCANRCHESNVSVLRQSTPDMERFYAARQAVLDVKQKSNVVPYVPHNLKAYISRHVACPERRAVLETK